jgi:hypothetical protein
MTNFQQKRARLAVLGVFFLQFFLPSIHAETYVYTEMGNTWSSNRAWERGVVPPTLIPSGDEVIIRGYCDLDMDIHFERGASLVIMPDATLFSSQNIGIENYGRLMIEGNFIADGMIINNYGEVICKPFSGVMLLCDRGEATWNNFGTFTIELGKILTQSSGTFVNQGEGNLIINGGYVHTDGVFSQFGTVHGSGRFDNSSSTMREWVNNGLLAPGNSPGIFQIDGDFRNNKVLEIELGGREQGVDYDLLRVGKKAYFGGTLEIKFVNGFVPQNREKLAIVKYESTNTRFETVNLPAGFQLYFIRYDANEVVISIERTAVLPIDLADFSAKKTSNSVQLHWATATEAKSKGVNIQHSTDGKAWKNIGFVKSEGKAASYDFNHTEPQNLNYYRLEQVDFDGKTALSKTISVQMDVKKGLPEGKSGQAIRIFPNPTTDVAHFSFETAEKAQLQIVDIAGKVIFQTTASQTSSMVWHTEGVARGIYFAVLVVDNQRFMEKIFVK